MALLFEIHSANIEDKTFNATGPDKQPVICHLNNPDRDWDKMMAAVGKTIEITGSIMCAGHFVVMSIV